MQENQSSIPATQNRYKSKVLWAAVATLLLGIAEQTGLLALIGIPKTTASDVIGYVLQGFTLFGVLNNPTNREGF